MLTEQEAHIERLIAARNRLDAGDTAALADFKNQPDPRVTVLDRMETLAKKTEGSPHGAPIAVRGLAWAYKIEAPEDRLVRLFELIARAYPSDPAVETALQVAGAAAESSTQPAAWSAPLAELARATKIGEIKLNALLALGRAQLTSRALPDAANTFREILAANPAPDVALRAKGYIFEIERLQPGMTAPDFATKSLAGDDMTLASFRGKTVLLNFWASWCPTCVGEIPHLKDIVERTAGKPFQLLNVSLDHTRAEAEAIVTAMNLPGANAWQREGDANPVALLYNVWRLPAWFLIDADGVIRARDPFGDKLLPALESLLGPMADTTPGTH